MLEVHPPDEAAHSWKDFLLHIATICVGLLIAIGLEQTVEAIHRAHERRDLREELQHESEQIMKDSESCSKTEFKRANWSATTLFAMGAAIHDHHALTNTPPEPSEPGALPSDPIFRGAMASNRLPLLSREEVEGYSEIHGMVQELERRTAKQDEADTDYYVSVASLMFGTGMKSGSSLDGARPEDLKQPYGSLVRVQRTYGDTGTFCYVMRYAAKAIHDGEFDVGKIQAAEIAGMEKLRAQVIESNKAYMAKQAAQKQAAQQAGQKTGQATQSAPAK